MVRSAQSSSDANLPLCRATTTSTATLSTVSTLNVGCSSDSSDDESWEENPEENEGESEDLPKSRAKSKQGVPTHTNNLLPHSIDEWLAANHWTQYREGLAAAGLSKIETLGGLESAQVEPALNGIADLAKMPYLIKLVFINKGKELYDSIKFVAQNASPKDAPSFANLQEQLIALAFEVDAKRGFVDEKNEAVDELSLETKEVSGEDIVYARCRVCSRSQKPKLLLIAAGSELKNVRKHLESDQHRKNVGAYMSNKGIKATNSYQTNLEELRDIIKEEYLFMSLFGECFGIESQVLCTCMKKFDLRHYSKPSLLRRSLDLHLGSNQHKEKVQKQMKQDRGRKTIPVTLDTLVKNMKKRKISEPDFRLGQEDSVSE